MQGAGASGGGGGGAPPGPTFKFRTLRISHSVGVAPALAARTQVAPLVSDLAAHLLRLDLDVPQVGGERWPSGHALGDIWTLACTLHELP